MPDISVTDEQHERFAELRAELAATQAGPYASVSPTDAMEYLLDLSEAADDAVLLDDDVDTGGEEPASSAGDDEGDDGDTEEEVADDGDDEDDGGVFDLLETHDDKWREGDGEEPYEVDLPDGGVESARTRDDIKAILFRNYR
ncbi:MAG: hypothetical protein ABEJ79_02715 [Halolamina sp.]